MVGHTNITGLKLSLTYPITFIWLVKGWDSENN